MKYPIFKPYGRNATLLEWDSIISPEIHNQVLRFQSYLVENHSNEILELVPAYNSLAVYVKESTQLDSFIELIGNVDFNASEILKRERFLVEIPVCYDSKFGLDIVEVANNKNISISELIKLHTSPVYPVYFIGFLPGFPYLGGLDKRLHLERRAEPRARVSSGSVAVGGKQTGIYPSDSPGGWNIIGRTPFQIFSVDRDSITLLNAGDRVRFYEISEVEFKCISQQVKDGTYEVRREVIND